MSTAVLDCPEDSNSTDCLLRAVLRVLKENQDQEDSKYDWDPVTFVFTVLLGVAALAFAIFTIMQGFVAARKGYRKAGKRAISTWAENTKKEWIWGELNYQYTAQTPIFRIDYLLDWDVDPGHGLQSATAATWIAFFKVTGLENVEPSVKAEPSEKENLTFKAWLLDRMGLQEKAWLLDRFELQEKAEPSENVCGLRSAVADFLPDDLVAAPAYAQGGVVIAAAAAVGIQRWPFTKGFPEQPVIIGRSFQFDFRQHPILGSIGSFSNHHPTDKKMKVPSPLKLKSTMQYAHGIIQLYGLSQSEDKKIKVNLVSDYESSKNQMVKVTKGTQSIHSATPYHESFYVSRAYLEEHVNANHCLFKAVAPDDPPELFPLTSSKLTVDCSLTILALCGKYWAKADLHAFGKSELGSWPIPTDEHPLPSWGPFDWNAVKGWGSDKNVLQLCLKQVNNPDEVREWYGKTDPATQQDYRRRILKQLRLLDVWLEDNDVGFRTADLYRTYLLLSHAEKAAEAKVFNTPAKEAGSDGSHANDSSKFATARSRHSRMMQVLRNLLDALELTQDTLEAVRCPVKDLPSSEHLKHVEEVFDKYRNELDVIAAPLSGMSKERTHLLLDRLGMIVVYNSEKEDGWPLWDRFAKRRYDEASEGDDEASEGDDEASEGDHEAREVDHEVREVNDVLIFRFILMVLLFQTAIDNSEVLNSSLWDRVIPII